MSDRKNNFQSIICLMLISVFFLSGCNSPSHTYLIKNQTVVDRPEKAVLKISFDKKSFFSVNDRPDSAGRIALSNSVTTAFQATPPPPGASPGGMAAAFVVATYMARAQADNAIKSSANEKAQQLFEILNKAESQEKISETVSKHFLSLQSIEIFRQDPNSENNENSQVTVSPSAQLSEDLRILEVKVDYSIKSLGEVIYKNSFIYLTDPIPTSNNIDYWSEEEGKRFFSILEISFQEITKLIDYEFLNASNVDEQQKTSTIKYQNERGTFFERGNLLWVDDNRVVLRDLRGNVRSFKGQVL